jgi:hypothetical protein
MSQKDHFKPSDSSTLHRGCHTGSEADLCPCGSGHAFEKCHGAPCECGSGKPKLKCCHTDDI